MTTSAQDIVCTIQKAWPEGAPPVKEIKAGAYCGDAYVRFEAQDVDVPELLMALPPMQLRHIPGKNAAQKPKVNLRPAECASASIILPLLHKKTQLKGQEKLMWWTTLASGHQLQVAVFGETLALFERILASVPHRMQKHIHTSGVTHYALAA